MELHKKMRELVSKFGNNIVDDKKLNNMLYDSLGSEYNQFRSSILLAQKLGVGTQLLEGGRKKQDLKLLISRVKQMFASGSLLERPLSDYIVDSYAYALGYVNSVKRLSLDDTCAMLTQNITALENKVQTTQNSAKQTLYQSQAILRRAKRTRYWSVLAIVVCFILLLFVFYFVVQDNGRIPKSPELKVKKMFAACSVGDAKYAADLLNDGVYINSQDSLGNTPMHYAVKLGSIELLDTLRRFKPDESVMNRSGQSPLELAVERGFIPYVQPVLQKKSHEWIRENFESLNKFANSPQMQNLLKDAYTKIDQMKLAIQNGDMGLFEKCLKFRDGRDLSYEEDGKTWLHFASKESNVQMLKHLLTKGLKADAVDNLGRLPEEYATNRENKIFLNHYRLKNKLIFSAVKKNDAKLLDELLGLGVNVNVVDSIGVPLVHYAVMYNYPMFVELQKRGANIHAKNSRKETALFIAVYKNNLAVATDLVKLGLSVHEKNVDGQTPMTVKNNKTSKYLLDITYKDDFFVVSVQKKRLDSALFYLNIGAKVDYVAPRFNKAAVHHAIENDDEKSLKFLKAHGANFTLLHENKTPIEMALAKKKKKALLFFLHDDKGAANRIYSNGKTLMHEAASMFARDGGSWIDLLLSTGAKIDALDRDRKTPLYYAICRNNVKLVNYLIGKKANVSRMDNEGNLPLHVAARFANGEIVKALVYAGADPFAENSEGDKPLKVAENFNNESAQDELENYGWFNSTKKKIKQVGSDVWNKVKSLAD